MIAISAELARAARSWRLARLLPTNSRPRAIRGLAAAGLVALAPAAFAPAAHAQGASLQPGDGVVTRFSGFEGEAGERPAPAGVVAEVIALGTGAGAVDAPEVVADLTAEEIGQVFAVEIDGRDAPAIYLAATSAYGLYRTADGSGWAEGMWGPDGGPGTIWKVVPGEAPVAFANVATGDAPNAGAALGALAFDADHGEIFVSDLSSGMIHGIDIESGETRHLYDHGVDGRSYFLNAATGEYKVLDVMPRNERNRPRFDGCRDDTGADAAFAREPACWGLADFRRRVWGIAVHRDAASEASRLYYAVWGGAALGSDDWEAGSEDAQSSIWSVGLDEQGGFDLTDVRREIVLPTSGEGNPVVDIDFTDDGRMVVAERARPASGGDGPARLVANDAARVLLMSPGENGAWTIDGRYAAGPATARVSGGAALVEGDDAQGQVWLTLDPLCEAGVECGGLDGGQGRVAGLAAVPLDAIAPLDAASPAAAPVGLVAIARGLPAGALGQVAVHPDTRPMRRVATGGETSAPAVGTGTRAPAPPPQAPLSEPAAEPETVAEVEPEPEPEFVPLEPQRAGTDLAVAVEGIAGCKPGEECSYRVSATNEGSAPFAGPIVLTNTSAAAFVRSDGTGWGCTAYGGNVLCVADALELSPGAASTFEVTLRPAQGFRQAELRSCVAITWLGRQGRERIRAVQAALRESGYEPGGVDGAMGPNTAAAIGRAEAGLGLRDDGAITGELIEALYGEGAYLDGDASGDDDQDCGTVAIELPPRPAHEPRMSSFHERYQSRRHDSGTSQPVDVHGTNASNAANRAPEAPPAGPSGFHDGNFSRFGSDRRSRTHDRGSSRLRDAHDARISSFHENFTSNAHDRRTSQPANLHRRSVSSFHDRAPSAVHDPQTSRGRLPPQGRAIDRDDPRLLAHDRQRSILRDERVRPGEPVPEMPMIHDRSTSQVRPARR